MTFSIVDKPVAICRLTRRPTKHGCFSDPVDMPGGCHAYTKVIDIVNVMEKLRKIDRALWEHFMTCAVCSPAKAKHQLNQENVVVCSIPDLLSTLYGSSSRGLVVGFVFDSIIASFDSKASTTSTFEPVDVQTIKHFAARQHCECLLYFGSTTTTPLLHDVLEGLTQSETPKQRLFIFIVGHC